MTAAAPAGTWDVGIDIGGTFTDVVAIGAAGERQRSVKVLSTGEPLAAVRQALAEIDVDPRQVRSLVHATTLAINTVVERRGARIGLITTAGFRDVLETGREDRYHLYDLTIQRPAPLVERSARLGVAERISARGEVLTPLDEAAVSEAAERLAGVDAVAVCFLNSYANDEHEQAAAELIRARLPAAFVTVSSDVAPIIREYERFMAAVINAYLGRAVSGYLGELQELIAGDVSIMRSDGGLTSCEDAERAPAHILESGPAAGVIAAARTAAACDEQTAIAFDMGGTTAKACLITAGEPVLTDELEIARQRVGVRGSGLPLRLPSMSFVEIGVGGGSVARINDLGLLAIGPDSAGADPGPACFGRGGERATVTDADLLLGLLSERAFLVDGRQLARDASAAAIERDVLGTRREVDVVDAAWGIHDIANEVIADTIRFHCVEAGIDPRRCAIVASGGNGPIHAAGILTKLGATRAILRPTAEVASAVGLLLAPRVIERSLTEIVLLDELGSDAITVRLQRLEAGMQEREDRQFEARWFLHLRFRHQWYELRVPVQRPVDLQQVKAAFALAYEQRFGRAPGAGVIEIVNWTVRLVAPASRSEAGEPVGATPSDFDRRIYLGPATGWITAPVIDHERLRLDGWRDGPLLVAVGSSTILVGPSQRASLDPAGNVQLTKVPNGSVHGAG